MALGATVVKLALDVADMDRGHYARHETSLAQHPSESDARLMVRVAAFALHAHEDLAFTRGMNVEDEPELWRRSPGGEIDLWVDFGQLDERRIRKACGRAREVVVYTYARRKAEVWWRGMEGKLARFDNLVVRHLEAGEEGGEGPRDGDALAILHARNLQLNATVQDGEMHLGDGAASVRVVPVPHG